MSEAYEVLGDDAKRAEFDQFGSGAANNPFGQALTFLRSTELFNLNVIDFCDTQLTDSFKHL